MSLLVRNNIGSLTQDAGHGREQVQLEIQSNEYLVFSRRSLQELFEAIKASGAAIVIVTRNQGYHAQGLDLWIEAIDMYAPTVQFIYVSHPLFGLGYLRTNEFSFYRERYPRHVFV